MRLLTTTTPTLAVAVPAGFKFRPAQPELQGRERLGHRRPQASCHWRSPAAFKLLVVVLFVLPCNLPSFQLQLTEAKRTSPVPQVHAQSKWRTGFSPKLDTPLTVEVGWNDKLAVSKTITTLQVVANPLLARSCSVAPAAWQSLADLGADLVRYVPWFPYPWYGVAELEPPTADATHWNFTFIDQMLTDFMNATYEKGHTVIPNFSTQPTWLYDTSSWSYPANPLASDFGYPRGNKLRDPSRKELASYYGRLASWLTKGYFIDERGIKHEGGHTYNLTHWEVFNEPEGCHGLDALEYTKQFDAVVASMNANVPAEVGIEYVGLALAGHYEWDWYRTFLNSTNHSPRSIPLDYVSFHFYATSASRTTPDDYEAFFPSATRFSNEVKQIRDIRDTLSPSTKLDIDEMGVILPDDNSPTAPVPPHIYYAAAGGMYAYLFGTLALQGVDVLGQSQLAGTPVLPLCNIPDPQYPSVSLLDWNTGKGNPRYWVLKLLLEKFQPGDTLVRTEISTNPICGVVDGHIGYGNLTIGCSSTDAVISSIDFASFGTPDGTCGDYSTNSSCNAENTTAVVKALCMNKNSCVIESYPLFGDPCVGTYKRLVVQAQCSSGGGHAVPGPASAGLYAQAFVAPDGAQSILLVNQANAYLPFSISGSGLLSGTLFTVDADTWTNPPRQERVAGNSLKLSPFATAVFVLDPPQTPLDV